MVKGLAKYYASMKLGELVMILGIVMLLITTKSMHLLYKAFFELGKLAYYMVNYGKLKNKVGDNEKHKYDFTYFFSS